MHRLVAALAASLLLAACHSPSAATPEPAPAILAQWSGPHGGADAASTRVVRSAQAWSALWQQIDREPPRAFDPSREIAVAIFLGERRTGGFEVEITGVRRDHETLVVDYREKKPARDAMVAQMLTSPWTVAVLRATSAEITFRSAH